jgi:hypothetical protein
MQGINLMLFGPDESHTPQLNILVHVLKNNSSLTTTHLFVALSSLFYILGHNPADGRFRIPNITTICHHPLEILNHV